MRLPRMAVLGLLALSPATRAGTPAIHGEYDSPLGRVRVEGDGATFRGVVVTPSRGCAFRAGDEVLRATLLDDSLAGQVRVCLSGKACRARDAWGTAVLLASDGALSGAVHVAAKGCSAPLGKTGGIAFRRVDPGAAASPAAAAGRGAAARAARAKAKRLMKDGGSWLAEGNFEQARRRFLDAIDVDA